MQKHLVFQEQSEIDRLAVQNRLLSLYEAPAVEQLLSGGCGWTVLDIGCNDGTKTVQRLNSPSVSRVIGLEYCKQLARQAQTHYGNEKFSFFHCDAESDEFIPQLENICTQTNVEKFDLIFLSFVLMHLSSPELLLQRLKPFLKDTGCLLVIEPNDRASWLEPDPRNLLPEFLDILEQDQYAGNRHIGAQLPRILENAGYGSVKLWNSGISAGSEDPEQKEDIFRTFFSYLPNDVHLLCSMEPDNRQYRAWNSWLQQNYEQLKAAVLHKDARIFMGVQMLSCRKNMAPH